MIRSEGVTLTFRYAAGRAGSRFLEALRVEGVVLSSRCPGCEKVWCPATSHCPRCGAETAVDEPVGPAGTLRSWHSAGERGTFGLVQLDGADAPLLHRVLAPAPERLSRGLRLRLRLRPPAERRGHILDIEGFEP